MHGFVKIPVYQKERKNVHSRVTTQRCRLTATGLSGSSVASFKFVPTSRTLGVFRPIWGSLRQTQVGQVIIRPRWYLSIDRLTKSTERSKRTEMAGITIRKFPSVCNSFYQYLKRDRVLPHSLAFIDINDFAIRHCTNTTIFVDQRRTNQTPYR